MALTEKQQRFVAEYLVDLNATQAAIRAGYTAKHADVQGPRLLGNAGIRAAVDAALARRAERVEVKQDDVLRELLRIAFLDISDAFDDQERLLPLKKMSKDVRRAIASLEIEEPARLIIDPEMADDDAPVRRARVVKLKVADKLKALELLGKHLKLFTDKVEHSGGLTLEQLVVASMKAGEE